MSEHIPVGPALAEELARCLSGLGPGFEHLKRIIEALQAEADARFHLAAIVNSAEDAIISKDLNGIIRSWNPGAERIFGYAAAEMIGEPILKLVPPGIESEELSILSRLRAGEHIRGLATVRQRKDGSLVHVSLTISPVRDASGQIIGASKIARDRTAERNQQAEQANLIDRLQTALAEIRTLRGLLPICMHCRKIRDDRGDWENLESYIVRHSAAQFSHSICPSCLNAHYGELLSPDTEPH